MKVIEKVSAKCFEIEQVDTTTLALNSDTIIIGDDDDIDEEREEWDDEMTFSDRIDSLIDPDMNIEKVVEMIKDTNDLSYTKHESIALTEIFIENFNKDYLIIKKR